MSNSIIVIGIILIIVAGILCIATCRLLFKKSIVFKVFMALITPIDAVAILAFVVGAKGIIHLTWAAPVAIAGLVAGCYFVSTMLRNPLNEMLEKVDSLAQGNVDITFSGKFQNGADEMSGVMRRLVKLTESLKNIVTFANYIGQGVLDANYELMGEKDTLGKSMLGMCQNLQEAEVEKHKRQSEDERRNWITVGVAKFADLLRTNNDNIEELCHSIVSSLVKYIGANQAGIFILNDDDPSHEVLELKACYAYERRKFLEKSIELGEGLIGTCFLEREAIYMTDIPKKYIHITSGLGDETPRSLLLMPLKINEEIYGVVEIAAFKNFEPHVREFVGKVAESIASTIGSVKISIRTNKLLEISKVQSEEMAGQEEELRQNMEEMQATQEEMARKQKEAEEVQRQLVRANSELETEMQELEKVIPMFILSPDTTITSVSESLLSFIQMPKHQVVGKRVNSFVVFDSADSEELIIEKVLAGESYSGNLSLVIPSGPKKSSFLASPIYKMQEIDKIMIMCIV